MRRILWTTLAGLVLGILGGFAWFQYDCSSVDPSEEGENISQQMIGQTVEACTIILFIAAGCIFGFLGGLIWHLINLVDLGRRGRMLRIQPKDLWDPELDGP
jgi:hypothetical protein